MRSFDIEAWTIRVLASVKANGHYEDSRVELKSVLPIPQKAARQLAGHANAARAAGVLWIIGVDEATGLVGSKVEDLSTWYQQLKSCFSDICPNIFDLVVHYEEKTFVALYFVTDRPPYLIKNPKFGQSSGEGISFEIPWREGTSTRTANRTEILTLLIPAIEQPRFEILKAEVSSIGNDNRYYLTMDVYVIPQRDIIYVYPQHKFECSIVSDEELSLETSSITLTTRASMAAMGRALLQRHPDKSIIKVSTENKSLEINSSELVVRGASSFVIRATFESDKPLDFSVPAAACFQLTSAYDDVTCSLSATLRPDLNEENEARLVFK